MKKKGNTLLDMLYSGGYNHSNQKLKYPFTHIKKVKQDGGILFPDATTYNQLGAYDGTIHYTQDTLTQPNGRPSKIKTNPGLFQSGGGLSSLEFISNGGITSMDEVSDKYIRQEKFKIKEDEIKSRINYLKQILDSEGIDHRPLVMAASTLKYDPNAKYPDVDVKMRYMTNLAQLRDFQKYKPTLQSGGSLSIQSIDENDTLPLGDSDLLSYRDKPVGIKMVLTKTDLKPILGTLNQSPIKHTSCNTSSKFNPFKRQSGGNIATTPSDFREGLNKGVNIFPFPTQGLKKMTMNPPSGPVTYPVEYQGFTDGVQTDKGVALPGEEFEVDGDTVVETPDLSSLSLNDAFDYAEDNKLPIFKWRNNTYPMKKYENMLQEGGLFSSKVTDNVKLSPIYTNE